MKIQISNSLFLIFSLVLLSALLAGGVESTASNTAGMRLAQGAGSWLSFTNANAVQALAWQRNTLWAGTSGGVVRWDLTTGGYVKYLCPDGLLDNAITAATVDANGRIWFGMGTWNGGLAVYDAGRWTTFREGLPSGWVLGVTIDEAGRKWIATNRGLSVLSDNDTPHDRSDDAWTTFAVADGLPNRNVRVVAVEGTKTWIGTASNGLSVLDDNGTPHNKSDDLWTTFTTADGLVNDSIQAIAIDGAGNKWIGTSGGGAGLLDDGGTPHTKTDDLWVTFTTADGLAENYVYAAAVDAIGRKWFGTGNGVSVLEDGGTPSNKRDDTWTRLAEGLTSSAVYAMAFGAGHQVWRGGPRGVSGLNHQGTLRDKSDDVWTTHITADWLPNNAINAVATEGRDLVWVGTQGGLVAFDGTRWTTFSIGGVSAMARDAAGRKWLATPGGAGVLSDSGTPHNTSDDTWTVFTTNDGLIQNWVEGVAIDAGGRKWFGTAGGVSVLDDKGTPDNKADDTWTSFTAADGMADNWVHVVAVDGPNLVWFAHEGAGGSVLDHRGTPHNKADDVWTRFTTADGLPGGSVYAIVVDSAGRKWFGACGGVCVLDIRGTPHNKADDIWTVFNVGDCNQGIAIDALGRKWIATGWSGVMMLNDGGTPHDRSDDVWTTYRRTEGLVDDRAQAIAVSSSGTVWVGTDGGLGQFKP
jgi:ligand-binding sensor domain-containing protein